MTVANITVGTRVRDQKTGLVGRVADIFPEVRPHVDLLAIRLDNPDLVYGRLITAYDGEVDVLDGEGAGKVVSE